MDDLSGDSGTIPTNLDHTRKKKHNFRPVHRHIEPKAHPQAQFTAHPIALRVRLLQSPRAGNPKFAQISPSASLHHHHLLHPPNPQNPREISRALLGPPAMSAPMEISFSAPPPPPDAACTVVSAPSLVPAAAVSSSSPPPPPPPQQQQQAAAAAAAVVAPSPADDRVLVSGERRRARVWASA